MHANGLEFGLLEAGSGPLALCLHGFPDCAHTWRHLLPALAAAGFRAVAPFLRGYAPTQVPADGCYRISTLAADVTALHEVLGGAGDAVLIGHDWGAEVAYAAGAAAPDRFRRLVTLAVPPAALDETLFSDFDQLRRFWYLFLCRDPAELAETVIARDDMSFIDKLWLAWSPGFEPGDHLAAVKQSLRAPANLSAAIGYYRAPSDAPAGAPRQPTLYLHGTADGCIGADLAGGAERVLVPPSRVMMVPGTGHFLHLEKPAEVNQNIIAWVTSRESARP